MSENTTKAKNIRDFISKFDVPKSDGNRVVLMDYAFSKYKQAMENANEAAHESKKIDTCSQWLISEVKKQADADGRGELVESSVNAALSKAEPSGRIIEAAQKCSLTWLKDFWKDERPTKSAKADYEVYTKIIYNFYDELKQLKNSPDGGEARAEAWKELENSIENAKAIVVCDPELRGVESFLTEILKSYRKVIQNSKGDFTTVPKLFVALMSQTFVRRHYSVDDFFKRIYNVVYESLDESIRSKAPNLIEEKVFLVRMRSDLCIRPEVFVNPNDTAESLCSGYSFFIKDGDGWSPIRLEREVTKFWEYYVGSRIKGCRQDPIPDSGSLDQDPKQGLENNDFQSYIFSDTKLGKRLGSPPVTQVKRITGSGKVSNVSSGTGETLLEPRLSANRQVESKEELA